MLKNKIESISSVELRIISHSTILIHLTKFSLLICRHLTYQLQPHLQLKPQQTLPQQPLNNLKLRQWTQLFLTVSIGRTVTFTCVKKYVTVVVILCLISDFYPHPYDSECASYIGCRSGEIGFYNCASPLLFHPVKRRCDFPEDVDCGLSCINRPNGNYPHPHDCSGFIICRSEVTHVFKCPLPLLFNPPTSNCRFPEEVECFVAEENY